MKKTLTVLFMMSLTLLLFCNCSDDEKQTCIYSVGFGSMNWSSSGSSISFTPQNAMTYVESFTTKMFVIETSSKEEADKDATANFNAMMNKVDAVKLKEAFAKDNGNGSFTCVLSRDTVTIAQKTFTKE